MDGLRKNHSLHKEPQQFSQEQEPAKKQDGEVGHFVENFPFDEGKGQSHSQNESRSHTFHVPTALVQSLHALVQTPTKCTEEYDDAIGTVTTLMSEMKEILDDSVCLSSCKTPTPMKYRQEPYMYSTPRKLSGSTKETNNDPTVVIKLSLLKQVASATDMRDADASTALGSACDGQHARVPASYLVRACQQLVDERDEMIGEALGLMESVREEADTLRRPRHGRVQIL